MTETKAEPLEAPPRLPSCPYVGLIPFTAADQRFFFGRDEERQIIAANLTASRLSIVYGPSGVGKSSLLHAGTVPDLRKAEKAAVQAGRLPKSIVVVFASWRDDPLEHFGETLGDAVRAALGDFTPDPPSPSRSLSGLLSSWTHRLDEQARLVEESTDVRQPQHVKLLVVLDQFEEYFLYHPDEDGAGTFSGEFPAAVNRRDLAANFLVSIRDDAYTRLDRFEDEIPNLFTNNIRIEHLGRHAAEEAIRGPIRTYSEESPSSRSPSRVESKLVDAVIEQVKTGNVAFGNTGGGVIESAELRVEAPFLQLVMERVWEKEVEQGSDALRLKTLNALGGAEEIVRTHVERAVAALDERSQDVAARIFGRLVTPSGTKIAYTPSDLAQLEQLPAGGVTDVLESLARVRIVHAVAASEGTNESRYEIFHDVLAPAVLGWSAAWVLAQKAEQAAREAEEAQLRLAADLENQEREKKAAELQAERERRLARRWISVAILAGALAIGMGGVAWWAWHEHHQTQVATHLASVIALRRNMDQAFASDPASAVKLAAAAVTKSHHSAWAVAALQRALARADLIARLRPNAGPVHAAVFTVGGEHLVTAAGRYVDVWDGRTGGFAFRLPMQALVLDAAVSRDGTQIAAGGADGEVELWPLAAGARPQALLPRGSASITSVSFDPDAKHVLAVPRAGPIELIDTSASTKRMTRLNAGVGTWDKPVAAAWDPTGTRVVAVYQSGGAVFAVHSSPKRLFWLGSRPRRQGAGAPTAVQTSSYTAVGFSPDGSVIVTGTTDGVVKSWNARNGRLMLTLRLPFRTSVQSLAFDGRRGAPLWVAVGCADGSVHLWQPRTGFGFALRGHSSTVNSVSFSPDGQWVLSGSDDGTAVVWNTATRTRQAVLNGQTDAVVAAAFSPDGSRIVTASDDGTARLWHVPVQAPDQAVHVPAYDMDTTSFSRHGGRALVAGWGGVDTFDLGKPGNAFRRIEAPFAAFNPDGTRIVIAGPSSIATWNGRTGGRLSVVRFTTTTYPKISSDRNWVALPDDFRGVVWLWRTDERKPTVEIHVGRSINEVALDANGGRLAVGGDGGISVWDTKAQKPIRTPFGDGRETFAISPDGSEVLGAAKAPGGEVDWVTSSGTVTSIWRIDTGRRIVLHTRDEPTRIVFSPGGGLVITAGDTNKAVVWNAQTGRKLATLIGYTGGINDLAFSPNGHLVVTAGADGTARVWVARSGELLATYNLGVRNAATPVAAAFTPNGRRILVSGRGGAADVFTCRNCGTLKHLLALAKDREPRTEVAH